jgi:hypothetical protein
MKTFKQFILEWSHTPDSITKYLKARGYKLLGKGVDQTAFLEPSTGEVLKVFGSHWSGDNPSHHMFKYWADYCKKHSSNPFLPKFSGWTEFTYEADGKKYLQIRMEKLQKLPNKLGSVLSDLSYEIESSDNPRVLKQKIIKCLGMQDEEMWKHAGLNINFFDEINKLAILLGEKDFNLLIDTIIDLSKIAKKQNYDIDLHNGNFMHRNDGTPIIVDPWVI